MTLILPKLCNMKDKIVTVALIISSAILSGCGFDDQSPVEKANNLLKQRNLCEVKQVDSVIDYNDTHSCLCAAYNLQWYADSVLINHQRNGTPFTASEKKDAIESAQTAYNLKIEAAKLTLKHDIAKDRKEFVGFSVIMADSLTGEVMRVFFDRDVTKITAIDRSYE